MPGPGPTLPIFTDDLLADLSRLPGASHSFLKQLSQPDGAPVRELLERTSARVDPSVASRWGDILTSLDNRRFFQGFGEVSAARLLTDAGWAVTGLAPQRGAIEVTRPDGQPLDLLVLGFIRQVRPAPDHAVVARLARALDRAGSQSRLVVLVRRWLPHDFDPEPVRRAVEMWLREVDRGGWDGRYAAYDDEHVSLEFALTREQAREDQGVVAFTLGPFAAHHTLEVVESRMVYELDAWRARGGGRDRPALVCCVSDQPWRINRGYLREVFLGTPDWVTTGADGMRLAFSESYAPALFRDPQYRCVSGVIMAERPAEGPAALRARAWLNPWADQPIDAEELGGLPALRPVEADGDRVVVGWSRPPSAPEARSR